MEIEIYKPDQIDRQTPHTRDELYVVISGSGYFLNGTRGTRLSLGKCCLSLQERNRFEQFTDDFSTCVFFYGQEGGEKGAASGHL